MKDEHPVTAGGLALPEPAENGEAVLAAAADLLRVSEDHPVPARDLSHDGTASLANGLSGLDGEVVRQDVQPARQTGSPAHHVRADTPPRVRARGGAIVASPSGPISVVGHSPAARAAVAKLKTQKKGSGSALAKLRLVSADQRLEPADIVNLRREFAEIIAANLPSFRRHMSGTKEWSQARLNAFKLLVSRVIPEVSQTLAQVEITNRNVLELSVTELAEIARGGGNEPPVIEHEPQRRLAHGQS